MIIYLTQQVTSPQEQLHVNAQISPTHDPGFILKVSSVYLGRMSQHLVPPDTNFPLN